MKKYILKRRNDDSEGDKWQYWVSCNNGIEMTTPFRDKATIVTGTVSVVSDNWKHIRL
jgi:hypothetical protein